MSNRIDELSKIVEAILFVVGDPISLTDLADGVGISKVELENVIEHLRTIYNEYNRGIFIKVYGENVQLSSNGIYSKYIQRVLQPPQKQSLTSKTLETLAIIAYKQPITKNEIEQIRGVKSDYSLSSLLEKDLIKVVGKKEVVGTPNLYATTDFFLSHFGIDSLEGLPPLLSMEELEIDPDEE